MEILIYLIGIPIAYLSIRASFMASFGEWTTSDRIKGIIFSFGSFASVLIAFLQYLLCYETDKKSNW